MNHIDSRWTEDANAMRRGSSPRRLRYCTITEPGNEGAIKMNISIWALPAQRNALNGSAIMQSLLGIGTLSHQGRLGEAAQPNLPLASPQALGSTPISSRRPSALYLEISLQRISWMRSSSGRMLQFGECSAFSHLKSSTWSHWLDDSSCSSESWEPRQHRQWRGTWVGGDSHSTWERGQISWLCSSR